MEDTAYMREAPLTSMFSEDVSQKKFHLDQASLLSMLHVQLSSRRGDLRLNYATCTARRRTARIQSLTRY